MNGHRRQATWNTTPTKTSLELHVSEDSTNPVPPLLHLVVEAVVFDVGELRGSTDVLWLDKVQPDQIAEAQDSARRLRAETASDVAEETATPAEGALNIDGRG